MAVLILDFDYTPMRAIPDHPVASRALQAMRDVFIANGTDIAIGSRMPHLFVEAEVGTPDSCDAAAIIVPIDPGGGMPRAVLKGLRASAIALKIFDETTFDSLDDAQSKLMPADGFWRWPDLVSTRKRKPG